MVEISSAKECVSFEAPRSQKVKELMDKSSESKTFKNWLNTKIKLSYEKNDKETEIILKSIKDKYNFFQKSEEVTIDSWKGKSGIIKLIKYPDKIIAVKMQKPDKNSEPKEIRYEISKKQLNALIIAINRHSNNQPIDTVDIAKEWTSLLGYDRNEKRMPLVWRQSFVWDNFFSWRKMHNLITVALNVLDHEGYIEYVGGKTRILDNKLSIQTLLRCDAQTTERVKK